MGNEPADSRQQVAKIEQEEAAQWLPRGHAHLQDDEPGARLENAGRLAEPGIEVHEVSDPEPDRRPVEGGIRVGQFESVGGDRDDPLRLAPAELEHPGDEIGPDDQSVESWLAGEGGGQVEGAGTEVEIATIGKLFPIETRDRFASPPLVEVQAEQVVQEIVARCDGVKHPAHVGALFRAARYW